MAYGMNQLRKAGKALEDFDIRYGDAVYKAAGPDKDSTNMPRAMLADLISTPIMPGKVIDDGTENIPMAMKVAAQAYNYGAPAVSFTARYGIPGAGITAAGVGIGNLANSMRQAFAPTPEEAMDYAAQFEKAGMPEYAAQMRAAAGTQTSGTIMPE